DMPTLDGSASSDPDGDRITYKWRLKSQPSGSQAALSDVTMAKPQFTVDVEGDYVAELVVNDGALDSDPDTVTVSTANLPPVASIELATDPVQVDEAVPPDGSGSSDPNGDPLTYHWSLSSKPARSTAKITNADKAKAKLVPDRRGDYVVQLIVN